MREQRSDAKCGLESPQYDALVELIRMRLGVGDELRRVIRKR